ncbi:MAG: hypothetical protein HQM08_27620 [Candidatus Riflebacteria bacterium]|nr:hypothetical protein [Candidatus Riflebacteria bacterium]
MQRWNPFPTVRFYRPLPAHLRTAFCAVRATYGTQDAERVQTDNRLADPGATWVQAARPGVGLLLFKTLVKDRVWTGRRLQPIQRLNRDRPGTTETLLSSFHPKKGFSSLKG